MKKSIYFIFIFAIFILETSFTKKTEASLKELKPVIIPLPHGKPGIGFDDLFYAPALKRILAPAGRTGSLDLIDPANHSVFEIRGFSTDASFTGGDDQSVTSADEGAGFIFATDRTSKSIKMINAQTKKILASVNLKASPDYIRFVAATNEIWVTEPDAEQIEIFGLKKNTLKLESKAVIQVPGGPESLVTHHSAQKAYAQLWKGQTLEIDIQSRKISKTWKNNCIGSRGIALDEKHGFLFVGCAEGKAIVLDLQHNGKILSEFKTGAGVDIIAFNSENSHLYIPASKAQKLEILSVSSKGKLSEIGFGKIETDSHCVATDHKKGIWVCDPRHGQLIYFEDSGL